MKRVFLGAALGLISLVPLTLAQPPQPGTQPPQPGAQPLQPGAKPPSVDRFIRGVIVSTDPKTGSVTLQVKGMTAEREITLSVAPQARFIGADHQPLPTGLQFRGFRTGADVWFLTSTGDLRGDIIDLRLSMPMDQAPPAARATQPPLPMGGTDTERPEPEPVVSKFVSGKVVHLDADARKITVRTGSGDDVKEQTFHVARDAEFYGPERQPLSEGLRYPRLQPGVDVWLRIGTGAMANTLRELRMHDPSIPLGKEEKK